MNKRIKKKVTKKLVNSLSKDGFYYALYLYDYNLRLLFKHSVRLDCYQSHKGKPISGLTTRNNAQRVRGIKISDVREGIMQRIKQQAMEE